MRNNKVKYSQVVKKLEGKRDINNYPYSKDSVFNSYQKSAQVDENIVKAINSCIRKANSVTAKHSNISGEWSL
jgi:hypothetical protein